MILAFTAAFGFWTAAYAAEPAAPITSYTLDNGLDVVLAPDHRAPKVVMNVRYSVGSMNEPAGRSGFAHLFEHLMFSGTEAWPNVFGAHSSVGNTINAWTMEDGTVYYVEGLSSALPMILSLEADRMANLGRNVDQAELDLQRSVVKNEMRQNVLDRAGGSGWEAFWSGLYPKPHPYSRTVIGSIPDLDSATLDDVQGFFNTYYLPNNAVLVLTGDFEVDAAKELVARTFGLVPRGAEVPRPSANAEPAKIRLDLQDRVPTPVVVLGYTGPKVDAAENGALRIAAELLGNAEIGALRQRLVSEKGLATSATAYWTPGLLGGRFTVEATAASGVDDAALESELRAALVDYVAKPLDPADVERARRGILLADRLGSESLKDRADSLGFQSDMFGKVTYGFGDEPSLAKAGVAEVEAVLRRIVDPALESVLVIRPGGRGGYPAVLTESSGIPTPFTAPHRAGVAIPKLEPGEPKPASLPAKETAKLSNGIEIVHYRMPAAPIAYVAASAKGGWSNAPQGKEGLLTVAANMAYRGAGERPYDAFVRAAKDIGAAIGYQAGSQATMLTLGVPADAFDAGAALLADAVLKPRFDAAEWAIAQAEIQDWLARREADLADVTSRAAEKLLFPAVPGKAGRDWSFAAFNSITREEAKAAFGKLFKPRTTTFLSVGPMPVEAVAAGLEKAFGNWRDDGEGYVAEAAEPVSFPAGRKVLLVPEPGASQSALYVARPAPGLEEALRGESVAVSRLLGGDFTSRLNSVIREEKGYSYGVDSYLFDVVRKGSALVVATTVERDATGPAIAEILKGFDGMATIPVTADEVNRTITAYRQALASEAETSAGLFGDLISATATGSTLEQDHHWREEKTRLQRQNVAAQAVALSLLNPALIVVAGDPDIVMPQLAAIGLTDVTRIAREDTPQPVAAIADRAIGLTDPVEPAAGAFDGFTGGRAIGATRSAAEARDARSTQTIHGCEEGDDDLQECATQVHQE
jgi:predicted Zn-dependent peptidase